MDANVAPPHSTLAVADGDTGSDGDAFIWFSCYATVFVLFYIFTSPFVGNHELMNSWTPYVYFSMGLHSWLLTAVALHAPLTKLGLLDYDVKQPVSLFFPIFFSTVVILVLFEAFLTLLRKGIATDYSIANLSLAKNTMHVLRNSAAISLACCVLIVHCDAELEKYEHQVCEQMFGFSRRLELPVPASYSGAFFIWTTGICLALLNFALENLMGISGIVLEWKKMERDDTDEACQIPPEHQLPMVPWYSMVMFDSAFQLLLSLKVFLGRFDMRWMQSATREKDPVFEHLSGKKEVWLDFMADCGDGFNSSYEIARLLAQPSISVRKPVDPLDELISKDSIDTNTEAPVKTTEKISIPRGDALVIGGDLAYPHPSPESYETRFWRCFEYAMKPPPHYNPSKISTSKPDLPHGCQSLEDYDGPSAFIIPGNHDWFDGLNTFIRFVCHRDWLGGWLLPQNSSYFILKLINGWYLLGCDLALENDIDIQQYSFFKRYIEENLTADDRMIIVTHEPNWVLDEYEERGPDSSPNLKDLINNVSKGRVILRLAGDLHHYTRHSYNHMSSTSQPVPSSSPVSSSSISNSSSKSSGRLSPVSKYFAHMMNSRRDGECLEEKKSNNRSFFWSDLDHSYCLPPLHMVVSGGGGAFLHPTHVPQSRILQRKFVTNSTTDPSGSLLRNNYVYERKASYPPEDVSRRYALLNVFGFRRRNWRFDFIGGMQYFALAFSMFPRCNIASIYQTNTWTEASLNFVASMVEVQMEIFYTSYFSLMFFAMMFVGHCLFADTTKWYKSLAVGILHSISHAIAATCVLFVLEMGLQAASDYGAIGQEGTMSLYSYFISQLPDVGWVEGKLGNLKYLFTGFAWIMELFMTLFDVPELVAVNRKKICVEGFSALSRTDQWTYYLSVGICFWVLATPIVGIVFGTYLYLAVNVFHCHYNESFSSLRVSSYKNFLRLHFCEDGSLEVFALGVDKVPRRWKRDPNWDGISTKSNETKEQPSYKWKTPSYWKAKISRVSNFFRLDFEEPARDIKINADDRSKVKVVDYFKYERV